MQFFNNFKTIFLIIVFHQLKNCHAHNKSSYILLSDFEIQTKSVIGVINSLNSHINSFNRYFLNDDEKIQTQIITVRNILLEWKKNHNSAVFDGLEETINYLHFFYKNSMNCLVSELCPKGIKNRWIQGIANSSNEYKETLSSMVKITKANRGLHNLGLDYFKSSVNYLLKLFLSSFIFKINLFFRHSDNLIVAQKNLFK